MTCTECQNKICLKTGKPCLEMERLMRKEGIYGVNYIRPEIDKKKREKGLSKYREIPFSSLPYKIQRELGIDQEYSNYNHSPKEEEYYK